MIASANPTPEPAVSSLRQSTPDRQPALPSDPETSVDDHRVRHHRAIWISDVHLGTRHSQVEALLDFLRYNECDTLYIVGDFIDGWELKRNWYWNDQHNVLIQKLLRKSRKQTKIILVTGNHDEFLEQFTEFRFGELEICTESIHKTATGERFLVIHGHQFDGLVSCNRMLEKVGSALYQWILDANLFFNRVRRRLGFGYWSFAAYLKMKAKSAVKYVTDYEEAMVQMAQMKKATGIICGHIHRAERKELEGVKYFNTGDWVESCTALVESPIGKFELIHWHNENSVFSTGRGTGAHDPGHRVETGA